MNRDLRVVRFIVVYIGISCDHLHFCVLNLSDLYVCCIGIIVQKDGPGCCSGARSGLSSSRAGMGSLDCLVIFSNSSCE